MKRVLMVLLAVVVATAWVGCQPATPAKPSAPAEQATPADNSTASTTPSSPDATATAEVKLVTLSVPNMT